MGTHPIFESDFDCLTVQQWFSDSLTDELCLTTPLPTRERLSRPQVADSSTKELVKPPKLQYAVTLGTFSVVSKPVVHVNWLNTPNAKSPLPVPTVVPSVALLSDPESSVLSSSKNRRLSSRY